MEQKRKQIKHRTAEELMKESEFRRYHPPRKAISGRPSRSSASWCGKGRHREGLKGNGPSASGRGK
jgi:hypothetical protein